MLSLSRKYLFFASNRQFGQEQITENQLVQSCNSVLLRVSISHFIQSSFTLADPELQVLYPQTYKTALNSAYFFKLLATIFCFAFNLLAFQPWAAAYDFTVALRGKEVLRCQSHFCVALVYSSRYLHFVFLYLYLFFGQSSWPDKS